MEEGEEGTTAQDGPEDGEAGEEDGEDDAAGAGTRLYPCCAVLDAMMYAVLYAVLDAVLHAVLYAVLCCTLDLPSTSNTVVLGRGLPWCACHCGLSGGAAGEGEEEPEEPAEVVDPVAAAVEGTCATGPPPLCGLVCVAIRSL